MKHKSGYIIFCFWIFWCVCVLKFENYSNRSQKMVSSRQNHTIYNKEMRSPHMMRPRCQRKGKGAGLCLSLHRCGAGQVFTSSQSHKGSIISQFMFYTRKLKNPIPKKFYPRSQKQQRQGPHEGSTAQPLLQPQHHTLPFTAGDNHTAVGTSARQAWLWKRLEHKNMKMLFHSGSAQKRF